ncbi:hypothetical protein BLOT_016183 [Blomia tropicalis]|nr:hypothetical protein BLOT_016183 [Blomia tropicalis]
MFVDHSSPMGNNQTVNMNAKILNSHVVNVQSSPNVHHVPISHSQSLGIIGQSSTSIASIQQSTDSQSLQQHLNSQSNTVQSQAGQFIQASQSPNQHISVSVNNQQKQMLTANVTSSGQTTQVSIPVSSARMIPANLSQYNKQMLALKQFQRQQQSSQQQQQQQLIAQQLQQGQQSQQPQQQGQCNQMTPQPRHVHMQPVRGQVSTQSGSPRVQITTMGGQTVNANLNQSLISTANLKQIISSSAASSVPSTVNMQSPGSILGSSSQRILTSSASPSQVIPTTVSGPIITTSKMTSGNTPIIARTIRADSLNLHGSVTVVPSSLANSNSVTGVPIGNQLRHIQLLQKRPQPAIQVSAAGNSQQVLMHKAIVQPSTGIMVSSDGQQTHVVPSSSSNIISPLLQSTSTSSINKSSNTYHFVPASMVQQQSGSKTVLTSPSVTVQMQQALKQGQLIMQQPTQSGGQVTQSANVSNKSVKIKFAPNSANSMGVSTFGIRIPTDKIKLNAAPASDTTVLPTPINSIDYNYEAYIYTSSLTLSFFYCMSIVNTSSIVNSSKTNFVLTPQPSPQLKTSTSQHFIAVSNPDSQSSVGVNAATIKLLPTSATAALALQQGQPTTSSTLSSVPQNITTPKNHIIISGAAAASLVGQSSGMVSATTTTSATSHLNPSTLLQQVTGAQNASNAGQTLTFAIRAAHGQQIPSTGQPGTVHLSALTLKTPNTSSVAMQQSASFTTTSGTQQQQQQQSALVAALSQTSSTESYQNVTPVSSNSTLLRTLASSNASTKTIPIVLMQQSANNNLMSQNTPSLLNFNNATNSNTNIGNTSRPNSATGVKITTSTQTSSATLGSILNAATKVVPTSESHFTNTSSSSITTKQVESPLIEALMSPISKPVRNIAQYQTKQDEPPSDNNDI